MPDTLKEKWLIDADHSVLAASGALICKCNDEKTARHIATLQVENYQRRAVEQLRHPYEDIPTMANFVMSSACDDHYAFMRLWIHGEWDKLDKEFPEWKAIFEKKAA